MALGPAYGGPGLAMAAPVTTCGSTGTFALTAASGVFQDIGGDVGRIRATAPATGRFIVSIGIHGAADGLPSAQKVYVRLTLDGSPVANTAHMIISNEASNNTQATCSCARVFSLTAGQEIEVEVARSDGAQPASVISDGTGCTGLQLTQIPESAHS